MYRSSIDASRRGNVVSEKQMDHRDRIVEEKMRCSNIEIGDNGVKI